MTPEAPEKILRERANFMGLGVDAYLESTPRQRAVMKAQFVKRLKKEARDSGESEDEFVEAKLRSFPEIETVTTSSGQVLTRITPERRKEIEERAARAVAGIPDPPKYKPLPPPYVEQDGIRVYTTGDAEVPPAEHDPTKRDGLTIGEIIELEKPPIADLVGDRPPRTLTDLYARWPIADDESYSIRIERTKPKRHGGVDVAGYIGEVRGRTVKESDLHRWLGGTEYLLTVYGPDPRGKTDINDLPIIKPLTEPIKLIVPVLPPNVGAIPAAQGTTAMTQSNPMNPFGPQPMPLTNQHDAAIHKTNMDFASNILKMRNEEEGRTRSSSKTETAGVFQYLAESQKTQAETLRHAANAQTSLIEKQLENATREKEKIEQKMESIARTFEEKTGRGFDLESLSKLLQTVGPNREAESQRQSDYYRVQMDTMKAAHEDSMKQLRERHSEELRRGDERIKDSESFYKRLLEDERGKANEREKDLRAETEKIRREERDLATQRIADTKERFESELRQSEKSHERELRSLKESFEVKVDVADRTHNMTMGSIQERLKEAQEAAEQAREEAKESSDPVRVMEKAKAQAEAMGFEKKDDAPKTALERFAATAGAGFSQALSNINEWGPQLLAARSGGAPQEPRPQQLGGRPLPAARPQPQQAPQQQRAQPQARPAPRKRTRASAWATEDVGPMQAPARPDTPLGFQTSPDPVMEPSVATIVEEEVQEAVEMQPEVQEAAPSGLSPAQEAGYHIPENVLAIFSEEATLGFLAQADQSINNGIDATIFGEHFFRQFPEEATKMVMNFRHTELIDVVKGFPDSETSVLVMRDGAKWMEALWDYLRGVVQAQTA